jgi:ABC-2 type transport system permease protein
LKEKDAAALLKYSTDDSDLALRGDALSSSFYRASAILESTVRRYFDQLAEQPEAMRLVEIPIHTGQVEKPGPQTQFDLYAPGMIIFALLMIIPQTAMLVSREIRWRTLNRLSLAGISAWDFLVGISLAQMAVAVFQVLVIFLAALALGFNNQGSIWLAILVGLVISFSAIGMGLITACFVENDSQAANVGASFSMVQVFVSGAWFAMPPLTIFTLWGHQIDLFDIFPATSGSLALQQVLTFGAGIKEIVFRPGMTLVISGTYFILGVLLFQKRQMNRK